MAFSVGMQAFLAGRYYHYLNERYPDQAKDANFNAMYPKSTDKKKF